MTDAEFRQARLVFLHEGRVTSELLTQLGRVVRRLVLFGGLPPMYSPTGKWDGDAEEEVLADWLTARLIGTGQLAALLHHSGTTAAFSRAAEAYVRRHLINRLARSYAGNLYQRLSELLPADDRFMVLANADREQDVLWGLARQGDVPPWQGNEDRLVSLAWGLGEFETVRYREDAKKLSPVLEREELLRFVHELLEAAEQGLTLTQLVRVLERRFDLGTAKLEPLGEESAEVPAADNVIEDVAAGRLARAALAEFSARQVEVLREQLRNLAVREIAEALNLSVGTVSNEQAKISAVLGGLSDPGGDSQVQLLNALRDLLFKEDV